MSIIVNTTVLSNFAVIEQLDVLRRLYDRIHIPIEVYQEIRTGLEEGYRFYQGIDRLVHPFAEDGWIYLVGASDEEELRLLDQLLQRLHQGEAACLVIAYHRGWILLTDDLAARQEAERLGVRKSGSLGCLVLAVERGLCSLAEAHRWLARMIEQNYRSPVTDLTPLLGRE